MNKLINNSNDDHTFKYNIYKRNRKGDNSYYPNTNRVISNIIIIIILFRLYGL